MPLSPEDKLQAERLLLVASILTRRDLVDKLNANGDYLPDLAKAITTGENGLKPLAYDPGFVEDNGSMGNQAIEVLRAVKKSAKDVAYTITATVYSDPDPHTEFVNRLLEHIRA